MKNIYTLILAISLSASAFSQISLDSADLFQPGDEFNMLNGKNPAIIDVKGKGDSLWDFSSLATDTVIKIATRKPNSTLHPVDALFPEANTVFSHQKRGVSYLVTGKDSIMIDGLLDYDFVLGVKMNVNFKKNMMLMKFPFNYQDSFTTTTLIDTIVDTNIAFYDKVRIVVDIYNFNVAESYGKLKTVQSNYDVLKVYSQEARDIKAYGRNAISKQWDQNPVFTQPADTTHTYRWYAKGKGYQIAEATTDERNGACESASYLLNDSIFAFITNIQHPKCHSTGDGQAEVVAVGGSGNRTVVWSASANSQTTFVATNLAPGKHFVTVTDLISSATFVDSVEMVAPDSINITVVSKTDEGIEGKNGIIEINSAGGTLPHTYKWDKSASTTNKADDLVGGTHTVTVTDLNLCTKTLSDSIGSFVGISEAYSDHRIKIYPNPSSGSFQIDVPLKSQVSIYNSLGEKLIAQQVVESGSFSIPNNPGIYLIQIKNEAGSSIHQIVVQ